MRRDVAAIEGTVNFCGLTSLCEQRAYLNIAYISYSLIIYIKSLFHYCTFLYKKSTPKVFVYETLTVLETSICGDLIEVFDIFKGFEDVDGSCFFSKSGTELRGHSYELLKERSRLYVRKRKWVELRWPRMCSSLTLHQISDLYKLLLTSPFYHRLNLAGDIEVQVQVFFIKISQYFCPFYRKSCGNTSL